MSKRYASEELLIKVINDLRDFLPYLVLVGGWVPYLYDKYIWSRTLNNRSLKTIATGSSPLTTTDMDFGVMITSYHGDESIADRVRKLGYGERHVSMDRLIPFVPIVKGKGADEKAEVEFITIQEPPKALMEQLVGKEIKLNTIPHFNLLLESPITVNLFSCQIQIPSEAVFIFHKLLTFIDRENKEKLRKDLYYSYYMFRFSPNKDKVIGEIKELLKRKSEGKIVKSNIEKYFRMEDDKGPVLIEQENGPDDYISNIREDAYERIIKLLD